MSDRYKGAILSPTAPTVTPQSAGGIYTSSQQLQYQGQGVWPSAFNNPINNSLRFRRSATAYLNRTPASAGNRQIWTWSGWVKLGSLSVSRQFFGTTGGSTQDALLFNADNQLVVFSDNASQTLLRTAQLFRDPSAWYHVVVAVDTTQATSSNRVKIYVNGVQVTAFEYTQYPSQNFQGSINNNVIHYISTYDGSNWAFDGYLTEVNFVNAQQLTPSSFGTTDAYGIWQPIPYTGTYGTNGFYLKFTDNSALTTSSNVGLGRDFSGNANYWVTNNISITAGSTYDSMVDVPTNTNSNTANYCVLNPLQAAVAPSNANLQMINTSGWQSALGTMGVSSGKWYWEAFVNNQNNAVNGGHIGIAQNSFVPANYPGYNSTSYAYRFDGDKVNNASFTAYGATWTQGDTVGVALDMDAGTLTFYKNNSSQGVAFSSLSGVYMPILGVNNSPNTISMNFGQRPFSYTPPTGFLPLNTYNLPTPTILAGNQYFNATTYTGTGATLAVTNSGSMQPDFVWLKTRNQAGYGHELFDSVRGATKYLISNSTNAEATEATSLTAFNSNGFSVGSFGFINGSGDSIVGWQWRASNAAGVSNTQGTITSTVSANTTAGFSIVTYTGNSTNSTVGHGLGATPSMVIVKCRSTAGESWHTYHVGLSSPANTVYLNGTAAQGSFPTCFNSMSTLNSTVFSLGTDGASNGSGRTYVAYCFSAVAGYSAFGSYTGNGSADGPFIFTGFRPRFVMFKGSSIASNWCMLDSSRNTYNLTDATLQANSSAAELTNLSDVDFLSNGIKIRDVVTNDTNVSGQTYVYMAFAENPFKIARGR